MFKIAVLACLLSTIISSVQGHGYVQEITAGGTKYTGYLPYTDPYMNPVPQRIVRKVPGNGNSILVSPHPFDPSTYLITGPVEDLTLIDVQCNGWSAGGSSYDTVPAPLVAKVAAGSQIALNWTLWPDSHEGPMITYMARAPSDITKWMPGKSAVWFKIAESGKGSDGKWAAADKLNANNGIYTFTIPKNLKAGQYIIRHEM
ncbi:hypothetical protein E1B28_003546 [Marasmius oreades]|uniref:lytic cellulose monooxygenase (C4-dehydrogenating) n=1 Tax=Marasmius oreades TaxID=181124 RepID=A0A9P7RLU8_9AGAR|nr:uncharacterized protein E1B28_003546 [Marasmius oreades]KAG7086024.1 hypothetical protein E1B28_003546 [Marasmius oreades]